MNIRKNIDYSEMYAALDTVMADRMPQMELYCAIGKAVCRRGEKGAAVAASEYLCRQHPDVQGMSPRNIRRMRDFYRTYETVPKILKQAMKIGWIKNVVIMEVELTMEQREWYILAVQQFGWSKAELSSKISENSHEVIVLTVAEEMCDSGKQKEMALTRMTVVLIPANIILRTIQKIRFRCQIPQNGRRRCHPNFVQQAVAQN